MSIKKKPLESGLKIPRAYIFKRGDNKKSFFIIPPKLINFMEIRLASAQEAPKISSNHSRSSLR